MLHYHDGLDAIGRISDIIGVFCGDFKKIKGISWGIAGLFVAMSF